MARRTVAIRLEEDMIAAMKDFAARDKRTVQAVVELAMAAYLNANRARQARKRAKVPG